MERGLDKKSLLVEDGSSDLNEEKAEQEALAQAYEWVMVIQNTAPPRDPKTGLELPLDDSTKAARRFKTLRDRRQQLKDRLLKSGLAVHIDEVPNSYDSTLYLLLTASNERYEQEAERINLQMELKEQFGGAFASFEVSKKHFFKLEDPERGNLFSKVHKIGLLESIIEADDTAGGCGESITKLIGSGTVTKMFPLHEKSEKQWLIKNWASPKNILKGQSEAIIFRLRNYFGEEVALYFAWLGFYTNWLIFASVVGLVAFSLWLHGRIHGDDYIGTWSQLAYSVYLGLWSSFFLEFWKRYSHTLCHHWGMSDSVVTERNRADYQGILMAGLYFQGEWISPPWGKSYRQRKNALRKGAAAVGLDHEAKLVSDFVQGQNDPPEEETAFDFVETPMTEYYKSAYRTGKITCGIPLLITMSLAVIIATFSVLSFRLIVGAWDATFASTLGGVVNAITIIFFNQVWRKLADILTRWENHRTLDSFHKQLVFKIFLFQFVNSYTSLFYIAFFKHNNHMWNSSDKRLLDECKPALGTPPDTSLILGRGCMDELLFQLMTILLTNMFVGQAQEVAIPFLTSQMKQIFSSKKAQTEKRNKKKMKPWEKQATYSPYYGTFDEYNEMIIQYGYLTLFAASFPLAPLLALFNNMVEIRTDAIKFLTSTNRPPYRSNTAFFLNICSKCNEGAKDIGPWISILHIMGAIAVITNCALIAFSYSPLVIFFDGDAFKVLGTVVVLEHVLFGVKWGIDALIPDSPGYVRKDFARQIYIREQLFKSVEKTVYSSKSKH